MIKRKNMKVGNIKVEYQHEIFDLMKDKRKFKKRIKQLQKDILEAHKDYLYYKDAYEKYDRLYKISQERAIVSWILMRPKEYRKYQMDECKGLRDSLIDDLRNFSCFTCPINQFMRNLDLPSQIQDLYSFIAEKQEELLDALNEHHNCQIKMQQSIDPTVGDKFVGCRVYNNSTGVAPDKIPFDKDKVIYTESNQPINRTEDDMDTNGAIYDEMLLYEETTEGIYTKEEMSNMHFI